MMLNLPKSTDAMIMMRGITSIITAVQKSDGRDSSMVQRPIVIVSIMKDTIWAVTVRRPSKWQRI